MRYDSFIVSLVCAWVLWSETTSTDPRPGQQGWRIVDATETEAGCRKMLQHEILEMRDMSTNSGAKFGSSDRGYAVTIFDDSGKVLKFSSVVLYCLPDSVDPRVK